MVTKYQVRSPIQLAQRRSFEVRREEHPARDVIHKLSGTYNLTAVIEEDVQTLTAMKHVPGLISFICTLTSGKDGRVISQGRGSSVLTPNNRFVMRNVNFAFNSCFADAIIRATKLDTLRTNTEETSTDVALGEAYKAKDGDGFEPATEKQLEYLRQLIKINVEDDAERDRYENQLSEATKQEASRMIEGFRR